ncbi:vacuolar protein sorting-associated protein 4A [Histomonas meleagridis]|uniref:vacuolar protein sorting-associated protein 4A n=1 Tax=Histomonas meleagridis TaxID=135588 RepID=UPI003559FD8A|nr:vacuolar protein sorting-associated protein 4A [Histomonas meleagridis]KAH0799988.1 vacuolar protein sorting-associated protein 4A [Histomonas meleagridis]
MYNRRDNGMMYMTEANRLLQSAIAFDRSGNYTQAKQYYNSAKVKFKLASDQPTLNPNVKDCCIQRMKQCEERASALDNIQVTPTIECSSGSTLNSRPSSRGKYGNGGSSSNGGTNSNKKDDESGEFKDRISSAILVEKPNIKWDDVAGLAEAKRNLVQAVILPLKLPQFFTGQRAPWRGILLYGPPGTGKSFIAKATATEANNSTFLTVSTSDLVSKWVGESEKLIRALFDTAREKKPAIVFIDEIDSLLSERTENDSEGARRIKTEFLIQMDGVGKSMDGILILAATNIPWGIDAAVRRRFEKKIYIPLPDYEARLALVRLKTKDTPSELTDEDIQEVARMTEGYSGADMNILARDAAMAPVNRIQQAENFVEYQGQLYPCNPGTPNSIHITVLEMTNEQLSMIKPPALTIDDFRGSIQKVRPSVSPKDLIRFEEWTKEFGQEGN